MKNIWLATAIFLTAIAAIIAVVKIYPNLPKSYGNEWEQVRKKDSAGKISASPVDLLLQK